MCCQLRCGYGPRPSRTRETGFRTEQYAVLYVERGNGVYRDVEVGERRFAAGWIVQRFPGRPHSLRYDADAWMGYVAVPAGVFDALCAVHAVRDAEPAFAIGPAPDLMRRLGGLVEELGTCAERELPQALVQLQAWITDVHRRRCGQETLAMERACDLLSHGVAPQRVAVAVDMGYHAFRKQFRRYAGVPPQAYAIRRRIERAMALLENGDRTLASIADELGYSDGFALSAQFKRVVGVSPQRFRERGR